MMHLHNRRYLCTVPPVVTTSLNETAEAVARADEEKELSRATVRGWELLQEMQGKCMYFISGWWSYQFCYNGQVKQFHQLAPQKGVPLYPPTEDSTTPSYILGRVRSPSDQGSREDRHRGSAGEIGDGRSGFESTELQTKGDMRYLVQKLGAGTICDITGKERRIEVQVGYGWRGALSCMIEVQIWLTRLGGYSSIAILNRRIESDGSKKLSRVPT